MMLNCDPRDRCIDQYGLHHHGQETCDYSASFPFFKLGATITANLLISDIFLGISELI